MPLFNLRLNTWYGWDGKSDNLWAQSIAPILDPRELGMTPEELQSRIAETPALANPYRNIFGAYVKAHDAETAMVNIAKALAAYQETLTSGRSAFDRFRAGGGRCREIAAYPAAAQRGAKLFVGRARCDLCSAPTSPMASSTTSACRISLSSRVDKGRYGGILVLRRSCHCWARSTMQSAPPLVYPPRAANLRNWGTSACPSTQRSADRAPYARRIEGDAGRCSAPLF